MAFGAPNVDQFKLKMKRPRTAGCTAIYENDSTRRRRGEHSMLALARNVWYVYEKRTTYWPRGPRTYKRLVLPIGLKRETRAAPQARSVVLVFFFFSFFTSPASVVFFTFVPSSNSAMVLPTKTYRYLRGLLRYAVNNARGNVTRAERHFGPLQGTAPHRT